MLLSNLFADNVERSFDARLVAQLDGLIAAADLNPEGTIELARPLSDPLFEQVFSGRYWQISGEAADAALQRSRSLWDQELSLAPSDAAAGIRRRDGDGPEGQRLRLVERHITLPGGAGVYRFAVAADRAEITREIRAFRAALAWSLGALGLGLIIAVIIQVRYGLSPLKRIGRAVADIRAGRAEDMAGDYPTEVMPLVTELNALIDHNAQVVARARTHVGNLAHALKTPLTVLANEADGGRPGAETVRRQTELMRGQVDRYLARARTAAAGDVLGARTPVRAVAADLARTLARIHEEKAPDIRVRGESWIAFRGERQDLEEILGNLMDNACKWAAAAVQVDIRVAAGRLRVSVEDDGPGLPAAERVAALERGRRLDEAVPGSGLGLAIVQDIAGLYGGSVTLGESALGGLLVTLDLPAAAGQEQRS
ncbi:MAG: ATP-binding protein [Alphaproteobacteria bacterium]|nr:ATP-binding protein [Alphaproteobacteria bacterium]